MSPIPANLGTYHLFFSPTLVTVYRITEERDGISASEVTATSWPRVFARTQTTHVKARVVTKRASKEIAQKSNDIITEAASRLTDALCASYRSCERPNARESLFFWRYMPKAKLQQLMQRLSIMVTPPASKRIDQRSTVISLMKQVAEELKLRPILPHDLISSAMCERGTVTREIFRQLVHGLAAGGADES